MSINGKSIDDGNSDEDSHYYEYILDNIYSDGVWNFSHLQGKKDYCISLVFLSLIRFYIENVSNDYCQG